MVCVASCDDAAVGALAAGKGTERGRGMWDEPVLETEGSA